MAPKRDSGRFPRGYRSHTKGFLLTRRSGGSHWGPRSDVAVASRFYIYMAGQQRVDKVIIPGYITSGRSTYQSPHRSSGRSIAAGSTCQVSHAPHSGTLHAGLPGTRAPACCLESFITRIFLLYPTTFFILTNRQRNPRSVFPCSVTFPDAGTLGPGRPGFGGTRSNTTSPGLAAPRRVLEHVGRTSSSSAPGMYPSLSGLLRECFLDERRFPTFGVLAGKHRLVP